MAEVMKISCCWLYANSKYGYPVPVKDIPTALGEMANLGFRYVELEGASEGDNLLQLYEKRQEIKSLCEDLGLQVINFCPVLPELVSLDEAVRQKGYDLFKRAVELANFFQCATIQIDSYTPPLKFIGDQPYKEMLDYEEDHQRFGA